MDVNPVTVRAPQLMKAFPPGRRGVLLPLADRRTAALGVCLYTASKPWVVLGQRGARLAGRWLGARALPGRVAAWTPPCSPAEWAELLGAWRGSLGPFDGFAVYQRRQRSRTGLTMLITERGRPRGVVKLRDDAKPLALEQQALAAVAGRAPRSFCAPAPLGLGIVRDRLHWSAQSVVFRRPHRPALIAPTGLFDEVTDCLRPLFGDRVGFRPAHNDLTPWNLRRDERGQVWLVDWEDCGLAPEQADRAYFAAAARALSGSPMPTDLPREALAYWSAIVRSRTSDTPADRALGDRLMAALATSSQTLSEV